MNTFIHTRLPLGLIALAALALLGAQTYAQQADIKYYHQQLNVDTGTHSNNGDDEIVAYVNVISLPANAPWVRLGVEAADLGGGSYVVLRSMADADEQQLNALSLEQWQYHTAMFNGSKVMVELHVAPGDQDVFVKFGQAIYGDPLPFVSPPGAVKSQCGPADNRVASADNRVGRLYLGGCTAWRITTGAFLSAGHCVDFDPDQGGPGLPNGILDLSGVVEFNIPLWPGVAPTNDQYPINTSGVIWRFDGEGQGLGKDWAVFGVFANSNTGLLPHQVYGLPFRLTRENPGAGDTIRITGCGADTGSANFTLQTATGPYLSENVNGADISHEYQTDTEGGNSGSPIIWETNSLALGIHTNAGCDNPIQAGQGNSGTSFEVDALENALRNYINTNARFVDINHPLRVSESGGRPIGHTAR